MDSRSFTYVTGNRDKLLQMRQILGDDFESADIDVDEIQSLDPKEIARYKALEAYKQLRSPVLVEDTSLSINSLGGLPGPLVKWFLKSVGCEGIAAMTKGDRSAIGSNTFAFYDGDEFYFFVGAVSGKISDKPRGEKGFGWDRIFVPEGEGRTRAEMSDEESARYSGRVIALEKFQIFMRERQS